MTRPAISVVLPVRDGGAYIREAVGSVIGQTFEDIELIVIDDGSVDGSAETARERAGGDTRLRVIAPGRVGLVAALNAGLEAALAPEKPG
ncbi:MAG TPA: glycosyltransferase family 2 protein, partial [bacterium]|nr:glycosyltransferase family 2 protein [bacterium]